MVNKHTYMQISSITGWDSLDDAGKSTVVLLHRYLWLRKGLLNMNKEPQRDAVKFCFSTQNREQLLSYVAVGGTTFDDLDGGVDGGNWVPEDGIPMGSRTLIEVFDWLGAFGGE